MTSSATWHEGSMPVTVWVTDEARLLAATSVVGAVVADLDRVAGDHPDAEVRRIATRLPEGVQVSETLRKLMVGALQLAARTGGLASPAAPAYGPDRGLVDLSDETVGTTRVRVVGTNPGWMRIALRGDVLVVPAGVALDLGAHARATAADHAARRTTAELGCGVLVNVGGHVATAGEAPDGGWQVRVRDVVADPGCQVTLVGTGAIATASTRRTSWRTSTRAAARLADPRALVPRPPAWATVSVAAETAAEARGLAEAALVRGADAPAWLEALGVAARLVEPGGLVRVTAGWPSEEFLAA
ncbi:hypothetical protein GCM10027418_20070 [Mariniluteicoccus endophyticus]